VLYGSELCCVKYAEEKSVVFKCDLKEASEETEHRAEIGFKGIPD